MLPYATLVIIVLIHLLLINKKVESENIVGSVKILYIFASLLLKMTCLDKLCCLGYNRVGIWVDNQQESCLQKYSRVNKNHIWYIIVLISIVAFKMTCLDKSCCLCYNHVDIWVDNQRESLVRKYYWLGKNHIW